MPNNDLPVPFQVQCIDSQGATGRLTIDRWYTVLACLDNGTMYELVDNQGFRRKYAFWRFRLEGEL